MPRYYRKYTKTIVKAPKKSWNSGLIVANYDIQTYNGENNSIASTIISNDADNANPSPTVIKAKHIKVYGTLCLAGNATEAGPATPVQVMSYIVFVPQMVYTSIQNAGSATVSALYTTLNNIINNHPEWVMSMKNVNVKFQGGLPGEHDVTKFTQTSGKMKRNLKSGDKIMHFMILRNLTQTANYNRSAYFQYNFNTCTN